jgi:hypothetical protein
VQEDLIVAIHSNLKLVLLLAALCGLLYLGAGLRQGFLPLEWRHAIDQQFERIFPSHVYAPHPDMDWEFEMDFRQHPWHTRIEFAVLGVLTVGDACLISRVSRAIRKSTANPRT